MSHITHHIPLYPHRSHLSQPHLQALDLASSSDLSSSFPSTASPYRTSSPFEPLFAKSIPRQHRHRSSSLHNKIRIMHSLRIHPPSPSTPEATHISHGRHHFTVPLDNCASDPDATLTLSYVIRGTGPLLVVQCPGWGIGSKYLLRTMAPLEQHYTLLHFEPRGTGRSSRPVDPSLMGSYDMAHDLELLRRHIGVSTLRLLGHSNGGTICAAYASLYPHHVSQLILVAHQLLGFDDRLSHKMRKDSVDEGMESPYQRLEKMKPTSDEMFGQFMREFMPSYFYDPERGLEAFLPILQDNPSSWCLQANTKADERVGKRLINSLDSIRADTLIVAGRQDMTNSVEVAERTRKGIGDNAEVVVFEECGHFPWMERTEEFVELVTDFLSGTRPITRSQTVASPIQFESDEPPIGEEVSTAPASRPSRTVLEASTIILVPLTPHHADGLYPLVCGPENTHLWTYMPDGPFATPESFRAVITTKARSSDPLFFAVLSKTTKKAIGYTSYLRADPKNRSVEVGNILFSPTLQRTTAATEAMYVMARHAFETLGYRRYEWKCNDLNAPSKRAAERLGFTKEGVFRQHLVVKGRNRDTAWFSMLDGEWEGVKGGFEKWLNPGNFDAEGRQRRGLVECRRLASRAEEGNGVFAGNYGMGWG